MHSSVHQLEDRQQLGSLVCYTDSHLKTSFVFHTSGNCSLYDLPLGEAFESAWHVFVIFNHCHVSGDLSNVRRIMIDLIFVRVLLRPVIFYLPQEIWALYPLRLLHKLLSVHPPWCFICCIRSRLHIGPLVSWSVVTDELFSVCNLQLESLRLIVDEPEDNLSIGPVEVLKSIMV